MQDGTDWTTAYHEAGHAVMARLQRCHFTAVSIDLEHGGCVWMRSSFRRMRPDIAATTVRLRDAFEREYMTCYAGSLAQERFTGRRAELFEYEDDALLAEEMLQRVCSRLAEARAYHRYLLARARTELFLPPHWNAVHVLAATLMDARELRGAAAKRLIDGAMTAPTARSAGRRKRPPR
ncbi:MAG TPA: hypothetical protein VNA69_10225 [Thermoanaerobaculia bacterium]|nr:hypothetical protein [Thermoanaerobaculia bacterium]